MRTKMGYEWYGLLAAELDRAEQATIAWHASEPRIWSRMLGWVYIGFGVRHWRARLGRRIAQENAGPVVAQAVDHAVGV
jgi:hypothetical protein